MGEAQGTGDRPRAFSGGGAEAWSQAVSDKRGKEREREPAKEAARPWVCGKGGLRSRERTERRGRSRGCVRMEEQGAGHRQARAGGENTRREEARGESVNRQSRSPGGWRRCGSGGEAGSGGEPGACCGECVKSEPAAGDADRQEGVCGRPASRTGWNGVPPSAPLLSGRH